MSSSTPDAMPTTSSLPPPAPPPRKTLPVGVALLSILVGVYGFILFLLGLLLFVGHTLNISFLSAPVLGLTGYTLDAAVTIVGLIILGIAVALWRLRLWALVLALLFLVYEMAVYAIAHQFLTFGFVLALVIFLYLIAVNRHFR